MRTLILLARTYHPGPAIAVTVIAALLVVADGANVARVALLGAAVLAGQLTIGWSNDLLDAARDRAAGRAGKPLASGSLTPRVVRSATLVALAGTVLFSLWCGVLSGVAHLVLVVGSGWLYNLGVKSTAWSALPYVVAFGALPHVVTLSRPQPALAPVWITVAGAALGLAAHLLNVLPDLADDADTGVRGLPHRLGEQRLRLLACAMLTVATTAVVVGAAFPTAVSALSLAALTAAIAVGLRGTRSAPFVAVIALAVLDIVLMAARLSA